MKVEQSDAVLSARRPVCCEKNWEQYKKSWVVAMQMMQCLNAISKVKISKNLLLRFIYLDKGTAEYQERYLWNTLKWGQRYFNGFPWVWKDCVYVYYFPPGFSCLTRSCPEQYLTAFPATVPTIMMLGILEWCSVQNIITTDKIFTVCDMSKAQWV